MSALAVSESFFVSGGTMPEEALSYVERAADKHLLESLLGGKFCYVLNSRQMGKSSMCVRTKTHLEEQGVRTAFVDLTKIGGRNVTPEQWYAGLMVEVGRALGLRAELMGYWKDNAHLSPMQRLFGGLREVVLEKIKGPVVIFIDEIDSTRSLPFDTDEFFAGIRECYNRRVHEPVYGRLTFCLLGVAVPSDLIRNAQTTPFNVGERVYLKDFTLEEVGSLSKGLPGREMLVNRIHYWSHGHPFLTQSLCTAIKNDLAIKTDADVDRLVSRELFEPKARETNINLADVGNRVLNGYAEGDDISKFRADILSAYEKAWRGKTVLQDDESNRVTAVLKLSGLMRSEGKALKVRNPIYQEVFGKDWIKENMPGQEVRRQKRAFWIGVLRTAFIAAMVIALVANLAYRNNQLRVAAVKARDAESYEVYVADMNLMPDLWEQGDLQQMSKLIDATRNNASRGWEWSLWNHLAHQAKFELFQQGGFGATPSFDGTKMLVMLGSSYAVYDMRTFKQLAIWPATGGEQGFGFWLPDGKRFLERSADGNSYVRNADTGGLLGTIPNVSVEDVNGDGKWAVGVDDLAEPTVVDIAHLKKTSIHTSGGSNAQGISPDGKVAAFGVFPIGSNLPPVVDIRSVPSMHQLMVLHPKAQVDFLAFSNDGKELFGGMDGGWVECWSLADQKLLWSAKAQSQSIEWLSLARDDRTLLTCGRDRYAHVYSVSSSGIKLIDTYPDAGVGFLSPDGKTAFVGYWTLRAYDVDASARSTTIQLNHGPYLAALAMSDGFIGAATFTAQVDQVELFKSRKIVTTPPLKGAFGGATYHRWIFLGTPLGDTVIHDIWSGKEIATLKITVPHNPSWSESKDGKRLFAVANKGGELWDITTSSKIKSYSFPQLTRSSTFSPTGNTIAVTLVDGAVIFIDLATGGSRAVHGHVSGIDAMTFSSDGKIALSAGADDTACVYDVASGTLTAKLTGHAQSLDSVDISPDGNRYATGSDDRTVRIWDAKTARQLTILRGYNGPVNVVKFSTNGKTLITCDLTGLIRLWPIDNSWKQK